MKIQKSYYFRTKFWARTYYWTLRVFRYFTNAQETWYHEATNAWNGEKEYWVT